VIDIYSNVNQKEQSKNSKSSILEYFNFKTLQYSIVEQLFISIYIYSENGYPWSNVVWILFNELSFRTIKMVKLYFEEENLLSIEMK